MASKFPEQQVLFASWQRPRDIRNLSEMLVGKYVAILLRSWTKLIPLSDIAKKYPYAMELNVLVIGMPNVGKSTLLNALRNMGIKGRQSSCSALIACSAIHFDLLLGTPKAFRTSANPGLTQALSTRLKLCLSPLVYAFDTPGVMLPFLGLGAEGAERGVKLALIGT
jgi:ribosome biogenesis GTPase A